MCLTVFSLEADHDVVYTKQQVASVELSEKRLMGEVVESG